MKILLTNDDGYNALLFQILVANLKEQTWISDLQIAVPAKEQSWRGTSMSGHGVIHLQEGEVSGCKAILIDGTPADCVDWGVHNLFQDKPDFVISGVNCGENTGLGFVASSGTVGAALHANLMNPSITGVAISQCFFDSDKYRRVKSANLSRQERDHLFSEVPKALDKIWEFLKSREDFPHFDGVVSRTWSFNIPDQAASELKIVQAKIGKSVLGRCFKKVDNGFKHQLSRYFEDTDPQTDGQIVRAGYIAFTEIDLKKLL
ncbi:MAG: 5'/3'-nucleotidase SurE [Bdellovibrionota bacterium]|jgi:5'/3'-nucleotidase SurE